MAWINRFWDPAIVSALAAIFGSFGGALASTLSAWLTQRHHDRRDLLAKGISHREQLYSDFISESARAMILTTYSAPNFTATRASFGVSAFARTPSLRARSAHVIRVANSPESSGSCIATLPAST